jgi:hypothetical protein
MHVLLADNLSLFESKQPPKLSLLCASRKLRDRRHFLTGVIHAEFRHPAHPLSKTCRPRPLPQPHGIISVIPGLIFTVPSRELKLAS